MAVNERFLEEKLVEIEKARDWSPRTISKLEALLRSADDDGLFRVNPLQFGTEKNISEQETIDLFIYASKIGIFQMNWQLLCPSCSDTVESFRDLKSLHSHFYCSMCQLKSEASLDDYIQVSFTISPQIREISFHNPDSLSIEDYYFKYRFTRGAHIPEGPSFIEAIHQMTRHLSYLMPQEKKKVEIDLTPGFLIGSDLIHKTGFLFKVEEGSGGRSSLGVQLKGGQLQSEQASLKAGKCILEFENFDKTKGSLLLFWVPPDYFGKPAQPLKFDPFLSGKRILTTQSFRELFRSEVIEGSDGIKVRDIVFLFTDLKGSTALYERIGDLQAFSLVHQHFESLTKIIQNHNGAIVKTIGDAVMATFINPNDAVAAAHLMIEEIAIFNKTRGADDIVLKIGIHRGPAIAVTLNDRMDYFGQTVNIAARVQALADAEEIYITQEIFDYPGVKEFLVRFSITPEKAALKGIQSEMPVYKVKFEREKAGIS